jgi:hypothetical protein
VIDFTKNPNTPILLSASDVAAIRARDEKRIDEIVDADHRRRFASLEDAYRHGVALPPIWLQRAGDGSWQLRDGMHRLHLARRRGDREILAIEVGTSSPFLVCLTELANLSTACFERLFDG